MGIGEAGGRFPSRPAKGKRVGSAPPGVLQQRHLPGTRTRASSRTAWWILPETSSAAEGTLSGLERNQ